MGVLAYRTGLARRDMAIDLGTSSTRAYASGYGIVLSEPTVVVVDPRTGAVRSVGLQAEQLLSGREEELVPVRPVRHGVVADLDRTERLLWHVIRRVQQNRWAHPRVVMSVPPDVNSVHAGAVGRACLSAGAREVYLIETPIAAALGAGLAVAEPAASMVLDVGAGSATCAVMSLGGIVASESVDVGGEQLNEALATYLKRDRSLLADPGTVEKVKRKLGSAFPGHDVVHAQVAGRDTVSDAARSVVLTSAELRLVLEKPLAQIITTVRDTLSRTPPELAADIIDRGIVLTGGGSLLNGLPERLRQETQMPVQVADHPDTCTAIGSGIWLERLEAADGRRSPARRASSVGPALATR
jgi:rod shape-determining protein MreB and related proteins